MATDSSELVVIAKITSVYGVKGWVKVHSFTDPIENLLGYKDLYLERAHEWQPLDFEAAKRHGKGLVALVKGVADRDQAQLYCQCNIAIPVGDMPAVAEGEYYLHQLEGLQVFSTGDSGEEQLLGKVDQMLETGANDVLMVKACQGSIDKRERLIPWLTEQVIQEVDLEAGLIRVDWDADF